MRRWPRRTQTSLFWRVFGANALVFITAGLLLALSPATVSSPITLAEATTLVAGIAVMLLINLALMRRSFAPLTSFAATMRRIDPLRPGERVRFPTHDRELSELVASFNEMLDRLENERRASAHRELQARDSEQRHIASELHDEIGQRLTILLLMLANAEKDSTDPATADKLQEARELTRAILDDVRGVVLRLRPPALDELGIAQALGALAASIEHRTGVQISRKLDQVDGHVSPVTSLVIYRIAQEALTNAVRHTGCREVELELTRATPVELELHVRDHGPGMGDAPGQGAGAGLRSMAERALLVGGDLKIDSSPDGTDVSLTVPAPEVG
jgi:two-component system, NarL family, sensor histidine kinase UhpB